MHTPDHQGPSAPETSDFGRRDIQIHDDFLSRQSQEILLDFLKAPGWSFGAYSDPTPQASRYWYKHFAGYVKDGGEQRDAVEIEAELARNAPILSKMWLVIKSTVLKEHNLARCYVNGYPHGAEGGLHFDSNLATHYTGLYYPHLEWHPNYSGETVFFDRHGTDIIASVYPRPNRLVVFPGVIPHIARGVSRTCPELRMTLMFKTTGT
jgi:SM-20-related protein